MKHFAAYRLYLWRSFNVLTLTLALMGHTNLAQQSRRGNRSPRARAATARSGENNEQRKRRRSEAVALLTETADAARSFDELVYRARIQMLAADAMWTADATQARSLLRRAWDAATLADKEAQKEITRGAGISGEAGALITQSRDEVLRLAARRDDSLASFFIEQLAADQKEQSDAHTPRSHRTPWRELSASGAQRLALALRLLEADDEAQGGDTDAKSAAMIAAPLINEGVSADLIAFILRLSERDREAADALYLRLLERSLVDPTTDANAVLLLSAPIVSPSVMVVVDENGALQFRSLASHTPMADAQSNMARNTIEAFCSFAATMLLREDAVSEAGTNLKAATIARIVAISRVLPLLETAAPEVAQRAAELRARRDALMNELEAGRAEQLTTQANLRSLNARGTVDPLALQLEQQKRARTSVERDRIGCALVKAAVHYKLWDRARRAANDLENADARRAALSFIALNQVADMLRGVAQDDEADFEAVAQFAANTDLPALARAWCFAEAAVAAARQDKRQRGVELLDIAAREAERVEMNTPQRIAAFAIVVRSAARVEQKRAWELLPSLIKAINNAPDYAGDESSIEIPLTTSDNTDETRADAEATFRIGAEAFRSNEVFATMARLDFARTVSATRDLSDELPRAFTRLAIARSALESNTEKR